MVGPSPIPDCPYCTVRCAMRWVLTGEDSREPIDSPFCLGVGRLAADGDGIPGCGDGVVHVDG